MDADGRRAQYCRSTIDATFSLPRNYPKHDHLVRSAKHRRDIPLPSKTYQNVLEETRRATGNILALAKQDTTIFKFEPASQEAISAMTGLPEPEVKGNYRMKFSGELEKFSGGCDRALAGRMYVRSTPERVQVAIGQHVVFDKRISELPAEALVLTYRMSASSQHVPIVGKLLTPPNKYNLQTCARIYHCFRAEFADTRGSSDPTDAVQFPVGALDICVFPDDLMLIWKGHKAEP
jgi:hypothetical protein